MKVYYTPLKTVTSSNRLTIAAFFSRLAVSYSAESDFKSVDKEVRFKFFEDNECFVVVVLTIKDQKNFCEGEDTGNDFTWKMSDDLTNKIAETNILILNKVNCAGAYLHNEGSVRMNTLEVKLRWAFKCALRSMFGKAKRGESFDVERLVDSEDILKKVSRFSSVDEINATFRYPSTSSNMSGVLYKEAKSIRVVQRIGGISLSKLRKKKEITSYLEGLVKDGCTNVSVKGTISGSMVGETVGVADAVNSIHSVNHSDYIAELNGMNLSKFLDSDLYKAAKAKILTCKLVRDA